MIPLFQSFLELLELEDEKLINTQTHRLRLEARITRTRKNWFDILNYKEFQERFRLSKDQFLMLLNRIASRLRSNRAVNPSDISPCIKLQVALRFYATGSYLITCGDFCGISTKSAQRIVHTVSPRIAALCNDFIKFPVECNEILRVQQENFKRAGFIRAIGAIDCTHVRIQSYGGNDAEFCRNRKGFFSINVQAIADSELRLLDFVARWPGSAHDSTIFDNSSIKARFDSGEFGNCLLLGDAGYRNLPYLMTPLQNPINPAEALYNEAQIRTRSIIERCFGVWKKTFPILSIGSRFKTMERTMAVIIATAVLHNIIRITDIVQNSDFDTCCNFVQRENDNILHADERKYLIDNYFQTLV
ncbi:putative nuclease HARBI1 [Prorops nasuta]|uniref:putative nuclease HARBI1 n=1 Tax=Prorops nasuta TaxID=863751 RepID=UPI0034CFD67D